MTTTYGSRLRAARENAGLTQLDVVIALRSELPRAMWTSQTKIQRLEADKIDEADAEPFLLEILASLYGVTLADISPDAADAQRRYAEFVASRTGPNPGWTTDLTGEGQLLAA